MHARCPTSPRDAASLAAAVDNTAIVQRMPVTLRGFGSLRTPVLALLALLATAYLLHASSSRPSTLKPNAHARRAHRDPPVRGCPTIVDTKKEKAAILLLARDGDLEALVPTLANFEETFNARYRYPYVFLNEDGFSAAFEQGVRAALPSHAVVEFGTIPQEHWSIPDWLDKAQVRKGFEKMKEDGHTVRRQGELPPHVPVLLGSLCAASASREVQLLLAARARW